MLPERERIVQLARLVGLDAFAARFGPPQTATPEPGALRSLVDERIEDVIDGLVHEAAASDDITDREGALSYLEDRLDTLRGLVSGDQSERIRQGFAEKTSGW